MARQPRRIMGQGVADLLTRADVLAYVGPSREIIADGERLRLQDGVTPGGLPMARCGRRAVVVQNYTASPADAYVGIAQMIAPPTIWLPPASSYQPGQVLYIADETGNCSESLPITIAAVAGDTISSEDFVQMTSRYQKLAFHSNGANLWTFA